MFTNNINMNQIQKKMNMRLFAAISCPDLSEDERLEKVRKEVENGAEITAVDKNTEETVLQTALRENYFKIVDYLQAKLVSEQNFKPNGENTLKLIPEKFKEKEFELRKSVNIPKDGNCLFWSVAFAYLIPVKDDIEQLKIRLHNLSSEVLLDLSNLLIKTILFLNSDILIGNMSKGCRNINLGQ